MDSDFLRRRWEHVVASTSTRAIRKDAKADRFISGIKKPACGRLLGDWLDSFLVNRASLQNVHPALASGCGTWGENHLPGRCDLGLGRVDAQMWGAAY